MASSTPPENGHSMHRWLNFYREQKKRARFSRRALRRLTAAQLEQDRREELDSLTWDTLTRSWF